VSVATPKRAVAGFRATRPSLRDRDPATVVADMLDELQAISEQLAEIADSTANDAVRVGAIGRRLTVLRETRELMQATGVLPNDLGQLAVAIDLKAAADRMVAALESPRRPARGHRRADDGDAARSSSGRVTQLGPPEARARRRCRSTALLPTIRLCPRLRPTAAGWPTGRRTSACWARCVSTTTASRFSATCAAATAAA
jgi:hypothetical protein